MHIYQLELAQGNGQKQQQRPWAHQSRPKSKVRISKLQDQSIKENQEHKARNQGKIEGKDRRHSITWWKLQQNWRIVKATSRMSCNIIEELSKPQAVPAATKVKHRRSHKPYQLCKQSTDEPVPPASEGGWEWEPPPSKRAGQRITKQKYARNSDNTLQHSRKEGENGNRATVSASRLICERWS